MKIKTQRDTQGSVLVASVIIAAIVGFTLASYLSLICNQSQAVARAQAWNAAMPVAEAGVEEALTQLYYAGTNNLSSNYWTLGSDGMYHKTRTLTASNYYGVAIEPLANPVIWSTGYVALAWAGSTNYVRRVVQVTATNAPLFGMGLIARTNIILNGNNVKSDSFDSSVAPYSSLTAGTNGDVGSLFGLVSVGNADINGSLYLGPTATNTLGPQGYISGVIYHDFNMDFPDAQPPFTSGGVPPASGVIDTTTYTYVLTGLNGGQYQLSSLSGSVYVSGNNVLYVTGNANISSLVMAAGASVQIYVGGGTTTFGQVNNQGRAQSLQYWGLPGNRQISLAGNGQFVGTIDAPNATLSANGGGSDTLDIEGAVIVNAVNSMTGHINFHFDTSLEKNGPGHYVADSWNEMPVN